MVRCGEDVVHLEYVAYSPKELRHELRPIIGEKCRWRTILEQAVFHKRYCDVVRGDTLQRDHLS